MAELGRIAQAAFRPASLLRSSTSRWQPFSPSRLRCLSTSPILRSTQDSSNGSGGPTPFSTPRTSQIQQTRPYSSSEWKTDWHIPSRDVRPSESSDTEIEIRKPDVSSYTNPSTTSPSPAPASSPNNSTGSEEENWEFFGDLDFHPGELTKKSQIETEAQLPQRPTLRLVPRTGRTVHITRNVDLGRSLKLLSAQLTQNRVKSDFIKQKFHERPGLKRKRLKGERAKRRFKRGFIAAIDRVKELTKQGW
ncbi:hypothetical protein F5B20DRAFT_52609 [Whalleya microplaca]|nr:hypothetical protein F5B20DRAFT_52609 [Whalleya microplaca]